jgi:hypothetical protein
VLDALKKASKGLQFISETEADLEPFAWQGSGDLPQSRLLELAEVEKGKAVEEMTLNEFFRAVPSEDKAKFDQLAKVMMEQLSGIKVFKIGEEAEKKVYILSRTADGQWAGLRTIVVET